MLCSDKTHSRCSHSTSPTRATTTYGSTSIAHCTTTSSTATGPTSSSTGTPSLHTAKPNFQCFQTNSPRSHLHQIKGRETSVLHSSFQNSRFYFQFHFSCFTFLCLMHFYFLLTASTLVHIFTFTFLTPLQQVLLYIFLLLHFGPLPQYIYICKRKHPRTKGEISCLIF